MRVRRYDGWNTTRTNDKIKTDRTSVCRTVFRVTYRYLSETRTTFTWLDVTLGRGSGWTTNGRMDCLETRLFVGRKYTYWWNASFMTSTVLGGGGRPRFGAPNLTAANNTRFQTKTAHILLGPVHIVQGWSRTFRVDIHDTTRRHTIHPSYRVYEYILSCGNAINHTVPSYNNNNDRIAEILALYVVLSRKTLYIIGQVRAIYLHVTVSPPRPTRPRRVRRSLRTSWSGRNHAEPNISVIYKRKKK